MEPMPILKVSENIAAVPAEEGVTGNLFRLLHLHCGSLSEAVVKLTKRELKCAFDETKIVPTFEEFTTILCQIETYLNSRPLTSLSNNPEDGEALTSAHFLIQSRKTIA